MSSNHSGKNIKLIVLSMFLGGIITYVLLSIIESESEINSIAKTNKPLYWVAPMDANYKRDKSGKSPMGMDLVPVYDDGKSPIEGAGTIRISPDVVNNLGVRTTQVGYKSLHTEIKTVGYVAYNEDKLVHIHPRVQGWIEKLHVKAEGDPVEKGQALYDIYSPELVNAQEELLLALDRKNTRLIKAAENRLVSLQLPKSAIAQVKKTRTVEQNITFYAPQNGVVEKLNIREGFFVKPGSTLMSIVDLSEVWVEAEVFERQAGQIKTSTPVTMTLDYLPGETWQGKIDYIYPTLDEKTRTVKVRLRFNNDDARFKPNMFAHIVIHTTDDKQVLLIPKEALIRTGNQDRVVLALGEGSFKSVAVKVGRFDRDHVEILEGLNDDESVVSSAQFLLDSESSKSSDFKRMNRNSAEDETTPSSVWVEAKVLSMRPEHKLLTLQHSAIPEWLWPKMTMDFTASDNVDLSKLSNGLSLHVEVSKQSRGNYQISNLHIPDGNITQENIQEDTLSTATATGTINALMSDHGMVNINRSSIEEWDRPEASIDFITAEGVNLEGLNRGMEVKFIFEVRDGNFVIVDISQLTEASTSNTDIEVPDVKPNHSMHSNH
jgi:Cu(I)/Ag(I) efflux system membrane fusion protein